MGPELSSSTADIQLVHQKPGDPDKLLEEQDNEEEKADVYGEDDSDSEVDITDEEHAEYCRQVRATDGFDVDDFTKAGMCTFVSYITPLPFQRFEGRGIFKYSDLALSSYNSQHGTNYQLVSVLKANDCLSGCGYNYFITFEATDCSIPVDAESNTTAATTTFQAKVFHGVHGTEVVLVRIKSTQ